MTATSRGCAEPGCCAPAVEEGDPVVNTDRPEAGAEESDLCEFHDRGGERRHQAVDEPFVATGQPPTRQVGLEISTLGVTDRGLVYCRIPGPAPPAPRPRATLIPAGNGRFRAQIYSAPRDHPVTSWKREAKLYLLHARTLAGFQEPLVEKAQPLEVLILRVRELAKTHHRKTRRIPRRWDTADGSGDWENVAKPVCDAANGIIWHDDCSIARGMVELVVGAQGEPDRLEIIARPLREIPERTRFEAERDQLGIQGGPHGAQH